VFLVFVSAFSGVFLSFFFLGGGGANVISNSISA